MSVWFLKHFEDTSLEPEAIKDRQCISQNKNNKKALVGTILSGKLRI